MAIPGQRKAAEEDVGFFQAGTCTIAVFPSKELDKDANVAFEGMAENLRGVAPTEARAGWLMIQTGSIGQCPLACGNDRW